MKPLSDQEIESVSRAFNAYVREEFAIVEEWVDLPTDPRENLSEWSERIAEFDSLGDFYFEFAVERFCGVSPSRDEFIRWFDPPHLQDHPVLRGVPASRRGLRAMATWMLPRRARLLVRPVSIGGRECVAAGVFDVLRAMTADLSQHPYGPSTKMTSVLGGIDRARLARRIETRFGRSEQLPPALLNMHYDGLPVIACGLSVLVTTLGLGGGSPVLAAVGLLCTAESVRQSIADVRRQRSLTFGELARSIAGTA